MRIAAAGLGDVAAVLALEREVVEAPHWPAAAYGAIVARAAGSVGSVERCLLVAWAEDAIAGFAVGSIVAAAAELESVVVGAAWRRAGVGRALSGAVVAWAFAQGAHVMELEVRTANVGAIALYAGLGFAGAGRRPRYYTEPEDDAVLMRLGRSEPV